MPIPTYDTLMLPLLRIAADGQDHKVRDLTEHLSREFRLSEEEQQKLLPSGQQTVISSRTHWARTYLRQAGLLTNPKRGVTRITEAGQQALKENPQKIDIEFLSRFPSFLESKSKHRQDSGETDVRTPPGDPTTPEEALEASYKDLRAALADDLLEQVRSSSPQFFERLVVELLVAMGYGGSLSDAGQAIGRTGDDGIDGIIKEDKLGLDVVCIQAKRWSGTVGRPQVQAFAGSMEGHRAKKGVLITTGTFSKDAHEYIQRIERKIVLIEGALLAQLMIDHDVGVTTSRSYVVKKLDSDYFTDYDP